MISNKISPLFITIFALLQCEQLYAAQYDSWFSWTTFGAAASGLSLGTLATWAYFKSQPVQPAKPCLRKKKRITKSVKTIHDQSKESCSDAEKQWRPIVLQMEKVNKARNKQLRDLQKEHKRIKDQYDNETAAHLQTLTSTMRLHEILRNQPLCQCSNPQKLVAVASAI